MSDQANQVDTRVHSVDALRGFDMLCLLAGERLVRALADKYPGHPFISVLKEQFTHPDWVGFTFLDLIFPLFEFLIGLSVFLSIRKRRSQGETNRKIVGHAIIRVVIMVFLGMMVNGNLLTYDPNSMRLTYSVLQMLAVSYLIATLFVLYTNLMGQVVGFVLLLGGYWAIQTFVPLPNSQREYVNWMGNSIIAPAHKMGVYVEGGMFSYWIDDFVFGSYDRWKAGWILESMTHGCSSLLGVFAAQVLTHSKQHRDRLSAFWTLGVVCLANGWMWSYQFPIIKNMWSSSFVLWTGGISFLLLGGFYLVIDVLELRTWSYPLVVIGANSIVAYMMTTVFHPVIGSAVDVLVGNLIKQSGDWQGILYAISWALCAWLVLLLLYRAKVFVRI